MTMNGTSPHRRRAGAWALAALLALVACTTPTPPGPEAPEITSFTATPATIVEGDSSTLAWTVVGTATLALTDGSGPVVIPSGATSLVVSPTATTTYTLTATNAGGNDTAAATVTVGPVVPPSLGDLTVAVVLGSQVRLDWTVANAASIDVLAVANGDADDELLVASLAGAATTHTFAIPASTRQVLRVCARGVAPADDDCAEVTPSNVVVRNDDFDPYDTPLWSAGPEAPIPGTLRAVLEAAVEGSVIGFAADVTTIDLYGVALFPPGGAAIDAHLVLDKDLTISGPVGGVTLTGVSGYDVGVDPDDGAGGFTYRSRVLYVAPDATVVLENLTLTGGTFIYKGGGIRNDGTLTGRSIAVVDNRAWDQGGGVYNLGTLTLENSLVDGNRAVTEVVEVGVPYAIRGNFVICMIRSGYGGGIFNEPGGVVTLVDTVVSNNEALVSGGGIYNQPGGTMAISGGSVAGNVANHVPYTSDPAFPDPPLYSDPDDGCDEDASAFEPYSIGGGVYNGGVLTMTGGTILDNEVNSAGGGLFIDRNLQMTALANVLIQGNAAGVDDPPGFGGGIQHEYYVDDGPASNYTPTNVTFGTGNTPSNIDTNPFPGAAPSAFTPAAAGEALPGRFVPAPGVRDR